jgi:uncharacterized protein YndB with AHSA1/START domain
MSQTITPPTVVSPADTTPPPPLVVTRTFAAPRERVFKAWTDPNQLARWFGPSDEYTAKAEIDLRVGGAYRLEMHHSGGNVHAVVGTYREIIVPEKLSFTWQWEGSLAPDTLVTIDFVSIGNSTEITMTHQKFTDLETRNRHNEGWSGGFARLERMLASEA